MSSLDVRQIVPAKRHEAIYQALDKLSTGEILEIIVDHRPTPLKYEIEATRPGQYSWQDGTNGPTVFSANLTCKAKIVDVRPIIEKGEEPFDTIMEAVSDLEETQPLVILAPFEPVPLEGVLSSQGFAYDAVALEGGDWRVSFSKNI